MNKPFEQTKNFLFSFIFLMGMLMVVWLVRSSFEQIIQKPLCFEYAHTKALPNINQLTYTSVSIDEGRSHEHSCLFKNMFTGFPVILNFNSADIPAFADTMEVLVPIAVFCILVVVIYWFYRKIRGEGIV